jgi:pimeloyl-ACP methyl ester carboxylesterase
MGGAVALSFALRHPDSVTGLILVATGAKMGVLPDVLSGLREDALGVIQKTITPLSFHSIDIELGRKARAALSLSNPDVFLNDYLACTSFDVRDRLGEITAPTLILCGDDDRMTPPKWSQYLHSNIPNSREPLIIRDAGHMLPLEKPTECASLIQGFLLDLSR